jgi:thymidine kinase
MFSGKTEELIRRLKRAVYAKKKIALFKPLMDDRYSKDEVVSHSNYKFESVDVESPKDIELHILNTSHIVDIIAIDEVQFLCKNHEEEKYLVKLINSFADLGARVIITGLDQDFKGNHFSIVSKLMAAAEVVDKLSAICVNCGALATKTQRIIDGQPAAADSPIILVGGDESYEARCRNCHEVLQIL